MSLRVCVAVCWSVDVSIESTELCAVLVSLGGKTSPWCLCSNSTTDGLESHILQVYRKSLSLNHQSEVSSHEGLISVAYHPEALSGIFRSPILEIL